jgi:GMP synthase (glutamine-hydrolysing)
LCRAIAHVPFEDLGTWKEFLVERGFEVFLHLAGIAPPTPDEWRNADLAVVLGGPISVNDEDTYPWITDELMRVAERLAAGRPLLGICLGAQMIAKVLGAAVHPGKMEIGWGCVALTAEGLRSPLRHLRDTQVLHWHGETFDLPVGARLLASTEPTPHQAFMLGDTVLAVQFHPEVDSARIESWLVGHACELTRAGIDPKPLRVDSALFGDALRKSARRMLGAWLDTLFSPLKERRIAEKRLQGIKNDDTRRTD